MRLTLNKLLLFTLLILKGATVNAQYKYQLKASPIHVDNMGKSLRLDLRLPSKNHVFYIGGSYLINPAYNGIHYNAAFANKAYAKTFGQHFMFNAGYERSFRFKGGSVRIYPFIEFAVAHTGIKSETYWGPNRSANVAMLLVGNFVFQNTEAMWIVNHTGIGAEIPVSNRIGITQQTGISPMFIRVTDNVLVDDRYQKYSVSYKDIGLESLFYSIGLTYKFSKK